MGKCHDSRELDALRVLSGAGMFTCTRLPGSPRLSEISCAGRWRRAQEDASVQLSACRACPVGAARNGMVVEAPTPAPSRPAVDEAREVVEARRDLVLATVRQRGRVPLAELVRAAAPLLAGRRPRLAERVVRFDLAGLMQRGAIRRLARGWYGTRRASVESEADRCARLWVESRVRPWRPGDLRRHLEESGIDLGVHPRQATHRMVLRFVEIGHVEPVGDHRYLSTAYAPAQREVAQIDLFTTPSVTTQRHTHRHKRSGLSAWVQLDLFAA